MGKIISFSNQKGGVGKTTTCVNMSSYLASLGKKVLMIDLDPQGNATSGVGFNKNLMKNSTYSVLINDCDISKAIIKTKFDGLDLLPSSIELAGAEVELIYVTDRERALKKQLKSVLHLYDFITIDCPPSLGLLTINALTASDSCIIPIQSEYYALEGLSQLLNTIRLVVKHLNKELKVEGVVLTMHDNRAIISKQISAEIKKHFTSKVYEVVIPRNIRLSEAPSYGVPIMLHDSKSKGAKAYLELTKEFLARQDLEEEE